MDTEKSSVSLFCHDCKKGIGHWEMMCTKEMMCVRGLGRGTVDCHIVRKRVGGLSDPTSSARTVRRTQNVRQRVRIRVSGMSDKSSQRTM